jgi:hypothetical protein
VPATTHRSSRSTRALSQAIAEILRIMAHPQNGGTMDTGRGARAPARRALPAAAYGEQCAKDASSPVTKAYDPWDNAFTGTMQQVTIPLK